MIGCMSATYSSVVLRTLSTRHFMINRAIRPASARYNILLYVSVPGRLNRAISYFNIDRKDRPVALTGGDVIIRPEEHRHEKDVPLLAPDRAGYAGAGKRNVVRHRSPSRTRNSPLL
ncbi:hypothetical protein [Rhizobium leguminosarum]|uniref:hypothetical protein n=1 Tax=Rhizobium leguminosarum TaxID=384 RepID=UPI0024B36C2A|nr:hypothetical protein [Rhizobium leguminosarum]WHO82690.1 hypothetical protein QMO81_005565 [Rhizobium leguminosarum]